MESYANLSQLVLQSYRSWSGWSAFDQVLRDFPDLSAYMAGGTVRNLALNAHSAVRDFDIFLDGRPVQDALERLGLSGRIKRGVYGNTHWYPAGETTLKGDLILIRTFDHVFPSSNMVDALNQFDFTGNAIAVDLRTGEILNPQRGIEDLARRIMRGVRFDLPDEPIAAGHGLTHRVCHWFRILHYAAALGLRIEPVTMRWLRAHRSFAVYRDAFAEQFKLPHPDALWVGQPSRTVCLAS